MASVKTDGLETGMVLERSVHDRAGEDFLCAGTVLDEERILLIRSKGVKQVEVLELKADVLAQCEEYAVRFFVFVDPEHPAMNEMYRLALGRSALKFTSGWTPPKGYERWDSLLENREDIFFKDEGTARDLVRHEVELASFPDIYYRVREVLESPDSSADQIAEVVSMDASLSAKLLKLVNSPFYGFAARIDAIPRAVAMVGTNELATLALGVSAISAFKDIPPELMDMKGFWKHSITCGLFARHLAREDMGLSKERLFVAGLLHDIGKLVMYKKLPVASAQALVYAVENSVPMVVAEREVVGFDHALLGGMLLEEWNLPENLMHTVLHHHDPERSGNPLEAAIVQLADNLAMVREIPEGYNFVLPGMAQSLWVELGLAPSIFATAFAYVDAQVNQIMGAFIKE